MIEEDVNLLNGLRAALDHVQSFVYIKNCKLEYVYANKHTLDLFGCTAENLNLADDSNFFSPDIVPILRAVDLRVLSGESTREEVIVDDGHPEKRIYLNVKTPVYCDSDPECIIGILGISTDITFAKLLEEKALKLAKTDVLTGLANRLELDSVLSYEIERLKRFQHPLSIIMLDLDHFKTVNDNYGHLLGDKCLINIAKMMKNNFRLIDTVGRWGGEEFLIICPETDFNGAIKLAEKFRRLIEEHIFPEVKRITGSLGVTSFIEGDTHETLVNRADKALYKAKKAGRNRVEAFEA
ncbi:diguanylate cyclase [Shewanella halifaxensis HAW-EB4]|uniref:diguanylate cyclase n=1 Tax=Shewanella halifaxensis (strain HAW-EB4) TaxID=458817 RepID=B0TV39_SHEHH|nr:GGDEF domain-containing protein [Shewanella halifaxensis]ABZ78306.1 diguanylate cyclase [Shewanella halifaxensis HAW-EB4]